MITISEPYDKVLKILGSPRQSDSGYRLMHYVLEMKIDDCVLLFNTLTREMVCITYDEHAGLKDITELRSKWFLVPQDLSDKKYADQVRFILEAMQKKPKHINSYTIFTTTDCNARCFYCFELGRSRISMNEETAHKTAAYIAEHCGGEKVSLTWFGGEPLFNIRVIDIICMDLTKHGIEYSSKMISNGYLFDDEAVSKALQLWMLKSVQITLDGTEEIYNRSKAYIYRNGQSAFQTVMSNIGRLLNADILVSVRLNIDTYNADNLMQLVDELHKAFEGKNNLKLYSHVLFEHTDSKDNIHTEKERALLYHKKELLDLKIKNYGMNITKKLKKRPNLSKCMADSGNSVTILPTGDIGKCEHYSDDHFIGHINSAEFDITAINNIKKRIKPIEECNACIHYPTCIRLQICSDDINCFKELRDEKTSILLEAMIKSYNSWLKKDSKDTTLDIDYSELGGL